MCVFVSQVLVSIDRASRLANEKAPVLLRNKNTTTLSKYRVLPTGGGAGVMGVTVFHRINRAKRLTNAKYVVSAGAK